MTRRMVGVVMVAGAGLLSGACGGDGDGARDGGPGQSGILCCSGQYTLATSFVFPACACQPPGTFALGSGVTTSLTVSGSTCAASFTSDAGTDTLTGIVVSSCPVSGQADD